MPNNISGNYETTAKEIEIVERLLRMNSIDFISVTKSENRNAEDVIVQYQKDGIIQSKTIEVKEESAYRINKYNDIGIDYISAFHFINPGDINVWKGAPKSCSLVPEFRSKIKILKEGKIKYSEADLWLFYSEENQEIIFDEWFIGEDLKGTSFWQFLMSNGSLAVNNKPASQLSSRDKHQSAVIFINRGNPELERLKQNIRNIF